MLNKKYLLLLAIVAFAFVLPVSAAQLGGNASTRQATMGQDAEMGGAESTKEYIQSKIEAMKALKADEKAELKETVFKKIQKRVEAMVQNAIRRYEKVQNQVSKAEGLTNEEKAAITAKIATQIETMEGLKGQVVGATTVEELKTVMKQVKERFKYSLGMVRQSVSGVYEDRLNAALTKMTDVYQKLSEKVSVLDEGGKKTELNATLSEVQVLLAEAKTKVNIGELADAKLNLVAARNLLHEVMVGLMSNAPAAE